MLSCTRRVKVNDMLRVVPALRVPVALDAYEVIRTCVLQGESRIDPAVKLLLEMGACFACICVQSNWLVALFLAVSKAGSAE